MPVSPFRSSCYLQSTAPTLPARPSPLTRALSLSLLAFVLALLLLGGAVLYFSYGYDGDGLPRRAVVDGLSAPVQITWQEDDIAAVRADHPLDAYAALGYVHGTRRAWPVALWRRTAAGRLSEWFGDALLPLDRHVRRLGLDAFAREACAALPADERAVLQAYARGLNAALSTNRVQRQSAFVLLDQTPDPWQPCDALALERLYAWLATPPPADSLLAEARADSDAAAFFDQDEALRRWLGVYGFEHSVAFALRDSAQTHLFQRHVFGDAALPLYQEVILHVPETPPLLGASLPGTPFFPAGARGESAWALLPSSTARLERVALDPATLDTTYARLTDAAGAEHLLAVRRAPGALPLDVPPPPDTPRFAPSDSLRLTPVPRPAAPRASADTAAGRPDTTWQLRWTGFAPVTDLPAWLALPRSEAPAFRLLGGGGLRIDAAGRWQVLGAPAVQASFDQGLVVSHSAWATALADELDALAPARSRADLAAWTLRDSSAWAARLAPALLASLDSLARTSERTEPAETRGGLFDQSVTYLRNWNFSYDRSSIAASIFDTWMRAYRRDTGRLPTTDAPADSIAASEARRRRRTLDEALTELSRRFGKDLSLWRWESVSADTVRFPLFSGRVGGRQPALARYAPLVLPGRGHPSALDWGPSPVQPGRAAPSAWEGWIGTAALDRFHVRRRRFDVEALLGRYRVPRRPPPPVSLDARRPPQEAEAAPTTTLVPLTP